MNDNYLFITGEQTSTNAYLMQKICNSMEKANIIWLLVERDFEKIDESIYKNVIQYSACKKMTASSMTEACVHFDDNLIRWLKLQGRIIDHRGYGEAADGLILTKLIERLCAIFNFKCVFASMEPYIAGFSLANARIQTKKALYMIDPPAEIVRGMETLSTPFRTRTYKKILKSMDLIFTTKRIRDALLEADIYNELGNITAEEFPLLDPLSYDNTIESISFPPDKINLLYCGWLRNVSFFKKIIGDLDERFCVTFIGNDCEQVLGITTRAEIRAFGRVDRQVAVNAIVDSDILICIGNEYPVHIPSKTFDYIGSGKPVIHFYSIPDCPAREYYQKYPLALCLSDKMNEIEATENFVAFCEKQKNKHVTWKEIEETYKDIQTDVIIRSIVEQLLER